MMAMRKITTILGLVACLLGSFVSRTASADDNKKRIAAEALFDQGTSLMSAGRFAEACSKFEASQALDAGIGTLLYLGDCYERTGRNASAWATFREAESLARADGQKERAEIAAARSQALSRGLSRLAIAVPAESRFPGLTVKLGGQTVAPASYGEYLPIDPGEHRVVVSAPGRQPFEKTVKVAAKAPERYRVVVPPLEPAPNKAAKSGNSMRTAGLVTAGLGVATLGAGAVLGVMASQKNEDSLEECPNDPDRCTPQGVALRDEAREYADWSTAGFAVGGGLIVTGAVLYIAAPRKVPQEKPSAAKLSDLRLSPSFDTSRLGLTLKGRFF
jgi:serine/threonine-protein kinase